MFNHDNNLPKSKLTFGQRSSDVIAKWGGSWTFIIFLTSLLFIWMFLNVAGFCYHTHLL